MGKIIHTGGARIGNKNATFPFGKLIVMKDQIKLMTPMGNLFFLPQNIISIEKYKLIPFIAQGIKINHKIKSYEENVIFWSHKSPSKIIEGIEETGFINQVKTNKIIANESIRSKQLQGAFPLKKNIVIGAIVLWNALLLSDGLKFYLQDSASSRTLYGTTIAQCIIIIACILVLFSESFRKIVLKENRALEEVKMLISILLPISIFIGLILCLIQNQ